MATRRSSWQSPLTLALLATVLTAAVVGAAGEFTMRYRELHRQTVPGTMPFLYYRHRRLRSALVRNTDYFGWVHIDRQGFRGADVALDKPPNVVRIMTVGSSTTFDSFVTPDSATWPARLQAWLTELAPRRPVEVVNAGVPGYRMVDHLIRLETELFRYHPDIIILYETHNDLFEGGLGRAHGGAAPETNRPDEAMPVSPWTHWLGRHSLLYTKLVERWNAIKLQRLKARASGPGALTAPRGEPEVEASADFGRDVANFAVVAHTLGIRLVLAQVVNVSGAGAVQEPDSAIRAIWWQAVPFAQPDSVLQWYDRYGRVLRATAARFSLAFIPTGGFGLRGAAYYAEGDPIHFNNQGADRMGQAMARALLAAHVLDFPRTVASGPGREFPQAAP